MKEKKKKKKLLRGESKVAFPFKKRRGMDDSEPKEKLSSILLGRDWKRGAIAHMLAKKDK